jgi:hypothetical protein
MYHGVFFNICITVEFRRLFDEDTCQQQNSIASPLILVPLRDAVFFITVCPCCWNLSLQPAVMVLKQYVRTRLFDECTDTGCLYHRFPQTVPHCMLQGESLP